MEPRVVDRFTRLALSPEPKLQSNMADERSHPLDGFARNWKRVKQVGEGLKRCAGRGEWVNTKLGASYFLVDTPSRISMPSPGGSLVFGSWYLNAGASFRFEIRNAGRHLRNYPITRLLNY